MEFFGLIWIGLLIACFITFVAVSATIAQGNKDLAPTPDARAWSVLGWILASIVGFGVWAFVCLALMGFGLDHGTGLGLGGIFANVLLYAGPALYLYLGYNLMEEINAKRKRSSGDLE